ncbi:hypothetical protein TNCV_1131491 [Trichonephila clavipes]|nr:hypothetical protein TNCV_1131491 [Trichonephila clavipes]
MSHRRIRAHYEQLSEFETGHIIGLKEGGGQIGESVVIWVKAMRPFEVAARTDPYATCRSRLAMNPASNCVLTIMEDVSGDDEGSVPILLSLLHATQALNQELWSGMSFLLTAASRLSSLEAYLQYSDTSTTF